MLFDSDSCLLGAYAYTHEQCCSAQTRQAYDEQRLAASETNESLLPGDDMHTQQAEQVLKEYVASCLTTGVTMDNRRSSGKVV